MRQLALIPALLALFASSAAPLELPAKLKDLDCLLCHPERERASFELIEETGEMKPDFASALEPVCLSCHDGMVNDHRLKLLEGGQHPTGLSPSLRISDRLPLFDGKIECGTCHNPHAENAENNKWLRFPNDGITLCRQCHSKRIEDHLGRNLKAEAAEKIALLGGKLAKDNGVVCGTCHVVHGAVEKSLLRAKLDGAPGVLCGNCHAPLLVKDKVSDGYQPCLDCHDMHVKKKPPHESPNVCLPCHADQSGLTHHPVWSNTCVECHSVHYPYVSSEGKSGMLRAPMQGGALCTLCHGEQISRHSPVKFSAADIDLLTSRGIYIGKDESMDCDSCHRSHDAAWEGLLGLSSQIICLYCHEEQNPYGPNGIKEGVHPVGVYMSREQFVKPNMLKQVEQKNSVLICLSCHSSHAPLEEKTKHCLDCHDGPVADVNHGGQSLCGGCHEVHGEASPRQTCVMCHENQLDKVHQFNIAKAPEEIGEGGCLSCHDHHGPDKAMLKARTPTEVCLKCHEDRKSIKGSTHDGAALFSEKDENVCLSCHQVHKDRTSGPNYDSDKQDPLSLWCKDCHSGIDTAGFGHAPGQSLGLGSSFKGLPLFDLSGRRNDVGYVTCPTCHDVHVKGKNVLRGIPDTSEKLCFRCHANKASIVDSSHDLSDQEGEGVCETCHSIHSAQELPGGLEEAEISGNDGTWNDRKCSRCHIIKNDLAGYYAGQDSHTVNREIAYGMKPENIPLYNRVGRTPGTVIACATCHNIHREKGQVGFVENFLRIGITKGELCTECHNDKRGVQQTPHDLSKGKEALCGKCHTAHHSLGYVGLWGLNLPEGEFEKNRRCESCHELSSIKDDKIFMNYHMQDTGSVLTERGTIYLQYKWVLMDEQMIRTGSESVIPLYDRNGEKTPIGNLQCVSCHDPHIWSSLGPNVKPSIGNLPDNVYKAFVKIKNPDETLRSICVDCHPDDVELKFKRYHKLWSDMGEVFEDGRE